MEEYELVKPLPHPMVVGELALRRGGEEVGGAEVRKVALGLEELHGGADAKVSVVEVDGGDDGEVGVLRRGHTEAAVVGARIGARPRAHQVVRVGEDGAPPRLQRHVRVAEARVRERVRRVHHHVAAIVAAAAVVLQQLAPPDVRGVGRAEAPAGERRRRWCGEEVRREQEEDQEDGQGRVARWRRHRGARIGSGAAEWIGKPEGGERLYDIAARRGAGGGARDWE